MKISAIILTKNEEAKIQKAVQLLSFCDEVLVIDDESTDETVKKAQQAGARVASYPKKLSFSASRNFALKEAKNEWVLFIDADEELSKELQQELTKGDFYFDSYAIPRRDFFWNMELKYGETGSARNNGIIRLIKKGSGVWTGLVHESFIPSGRTGKLYGFINHYSHDSVSSFIKDINDYSTIRAKELFDQGRKTSAFELIFYPFGKFIYTYFLLLGFLDGAAGFVYSFVMAFHSFLVRAKLLSLYD